jgi:methionine-rich copper-binding protein CopC/putative copper export protein
MKAVWSFLCALIVIGMPAVVCAHAVIEQAFPFSGAMLDESPPFVRLTFNEKIAGKTSTLVVRDAQGNEVGGAREDIGDDTIQTALPLLAPGTYTVLWQVLSADTHVAEGQYAFSVQTPQTRTVPTEPIDIAPPVPQEVPQEAAAPNRPAHQQQKDTKPKTRETQAPNPQRSLETEQTKQEVQRNVDGAPNTQQTAPAQPNKGAEPSGHAHHAVGAGPSAVFASVYDVVRAVLRGINNAAWVVLIVCVIAPYVWQNNARVRPLVAIAASVAIAATAWGQLAVIADVFSDRVSWTAAWGSIVFGDRFGVFAFVQTIVLAFGVVLLYAPAKDRRWAHNVHVAVVALALVVASLQTHVGTLFATEWRAIVRVVHVWAMSCWLGSVCFAAVSFVQRKAITGKHRSFAIASGGVAIGSGIGLAVMLLPSWSAMVASPYGMLLLGKSVLALLLAGVGWALRGKRSTPTVALEQLLCIGLVVCATVMGMTPPGM